MYLCQSLKFEHTKVLSRLAHGTGRYFESLREELGIWKGDGRDHSVALSGRLAIQIADLFDFAGFLGELVQHQEPKTLGDRDHAEGPR